MNFFCVRLRKFFEIFTIEFLLNMVLFKFKLNNQGMLCLSETKF